MSSTTISDLSSVTALSLESAASLLLIVAAYKVHRARVSTHSGCCGDRLVVETDENSGVPSPKAEV